MTPLCAISFCLHFFFFVPPPPPSRFSIFFFIPLLVLAVAPLVYTVWKLLFVLTSTCVFSGIFCCFLVDHTTVGLHPLFSFFVRLFLPWLHYCSIVLCLIIQQQLYNTHLSTHSFFTTPPPCVLGIDCDSAFLLLLLSLRFSTKGTCNVESILAERKSCVEHISIFLSHCWMIFFQFVTNKIYAFLNQHFLPENFILIHQQRYCFSFRYDRFNHRLKLIHRYSGDLHFVFAILRIFLLRWSGDRKAQRERYK